MVEFQVAAQIRKATATDDGTVHVYGWAAMSRDDLGEPVIDSDGEYISIAELEKAAQDAFVRRGGAGAVGVQHEEYGKADLVESFVMSAEKRQAFEFGAGPQGWIVGLRSRDPEVAKAVRSGALLELSLRGRGRVERKRIPRSGAGDILKADSGNESDLQTVGVVRELELADAELLSIVDRGASANDRVRSRIVLVKRDISQSHKGGAMPKTPVSKARSPQVILADLFESGKLADVAPEDKEALLMALSQMPMKPSAPSEPSEPTEPIESMDDEPKPKAEDEDKPMPKADDEDQMSKREKSLAKANADLTAKLTELSKRVERGEVVEMVKNDMAYFPGASVDELADIIQESRTNLSKKDSDKLEEMLKSASKLIKGSDALGAFGSRKTDEGADPGSELLALAKAKRDADPSLSRHAAIQAAGRERPDLWAKRA